MKCTAECGILFPSPYGEVGFDHDIVREYNAYTKSFRPLTGKLVLIRTAKKVYEQLKNGFRPLTGKLVLIGMTKENFVLIPVVSVPLRGS